MKIKINLKKKKLKKHLIIKINKFFDKYLNIKENINKLDGKALFELSEEGMKELGLNLGQRRKLEKYIIYFKTKNEDMSKKNKMILDINSSEEEVAKYLKEILNFCEESIEELGLVGETLFNLEEEDIEEFDIKEEEKEKLKEYLRMNNLNNKIKNKNDINEKYNILKEDENNKNIENEKIKESLNTIKEKIFGNKSYNKIFYSLSNYKIESINIDSKYNVFFPFVVEEKFLNNGKLSIYEDNSRFIANKYTNYEFLFINEINLKNNQKENFSIFLDKFLLEKK